MENIKVRCRSCGKELEGYSNKTVCCGCPNMTTIRGGVITAVDLTKVVMLNNISNKSKTTLFSTEDLLWQQSRSQRKIRKLDFEIR